MGTHINKAIKLLSLAHCPSSVFTPPPPPQHAQGERRRQCSQGEIEKNQNKHREKEGEKERGSHCVGLCPAMSSDGPDTQLGLGA